MAGLGFMGMTIPEEYDGAGLDAVALAITVEEVARAWGEHALIMAPHSSLCTGTIWLAGNEDQRRRYSPDLASGRKLGAWALTEPKSGSDAAAMQTTAKRAKDGWVLSGTKNLCTNAPVAGTFVIHAVTDATKGNRGISAFIVERGHPGLSIGRVEEKLGVRGSATSQVLLADCDDQSAALLGRESEECSSEEKCREGGG